jgi:hypothetical protein
MGLQVHEIMAIIVSLIAAPPARENNIWRAAAGQGAHASPLTP